MRLFVYVLLVLAVFAASVSASPVTMQVRGLDGGGYVLSHTTATSEISYTAFCLDKNLSLPGSADFTLTSGDAVQRIDAVLLQRAAWISQQQASNTDKQAAIWSVMGASVALSDRARELVSLSVAGNVNLAIISVLVPVNTDHQRYLVAGIASSTTAETPEPVTAVLLATGLAWIAHRRRKLLF